MSSGIYAIRNTLNGKRYVGSCKNFEIRRKEHFRRLQNYTHCNIKLQRAFLKYGPAAFEFEILELVPYEKSTIVAAEDRWISELNSKKQGYNIADATFGDILSTHPNRLEIIEKISKGLKKTFGAMTVEERRERFSQPGELNPMFGVKRPQYVIDAMRAGTKKFVEEHGFGPTTGILKSESHCAALSAHAKTRIGEKNPFFGKNHSDETKAKLSKKATGRKCPTLHPIILDGVRYERLKDAAEVTGISIQTLHYRAGSKNPKFLNIYFEDTPK